MSNQKPVFLMAGGRSGRGKGNDAIIGSVIAAIGRASPGIAYIGAASEDDKDFFKYIGATLQKGGAGDVVHAMTVPKKADMNKTREILKAADAVFVSGGDVERGMEVLEQRHLNDFLRELFQRGKLFFGASAGSIILAREWVRWRDPDDDSSSELFPCLGFASVICDTHAESDRWQELKAALALEKEGTRGFGIATGTCLEVFPDGTVEALGDVVSQYIHRGRKVERLPDLQPVRI